MPVLQVLMQAPVLCHLLRVTQPARHGRMGQHIVTTKRTHK